MQRYEKYKDSGVAWIGEIPNGWKSSLIKYAIDDIISGGTPSTSNELFWEDRNSKNGIPWVSIADITASKGVLYETAKSITSKGLLSKNLKIIPKETLLLSIFASLGKTTILKIDATVNQAILGLVTEKNLDRDFLKYYLIFIERYISYYSNSNTQDNLNLNKIKNLPIVFPSILEEQEKIATYLTKKIKEIDTLITQKEELLSLYEEEKKAIINQAVTKGIDSDVAMKEGRIIGIEEIPKSWKVTKFRFLFDLSKGLNITKKNLKSNGIPCVNYGEIHSKYGFEIIPDRDNLKCVEKDYLETSSNALLNRGDFVFADTSEDIKGSGNFTHLHSDTNIFAGYHTVIARLKLDVNYRYIAYFIESISFRNQIRRQVKGVKVYSITNTILKDIFIVLPLKEEQRKIVEFIENELSRIDIKIQKTKDIIILQKEYRTALISEAVTGKIKVMWEV